jgi:hypothetical protein
MYPGTFWQRGCEFLTFCEKRKPWHMCLSLAEADGCMCLPSLLTSPVSRAASLDRMIDEHGLVSNPTLPHTPMRIYLAWRAPCAPHNKHADAVNTCPQHLAQGLDACWPEPSPPPPSQLAKRGGSDSSVPWLGCTYTPRVSSSFLTMLQQRCLCGKQTVLNGVR